MKKYLLGGLAEPEQQELEQRLMTSNEYFEELLVAEDELVDEYLHGTLSAHEQEKFDSHFLCTPERREKLRFSRSLQRYVSANAKRPKTAWAWPPFFSFLRASYVTRGWSMATALLMIVLGGSWLSVRVQHLEQLLEQVRSQQTVPTGQQQESQQQLAQLREQKDQLASKLERQQKQSAALEQELAGLRASPPMRSSSSMVAFALTPGRFRDMGGVKKVLVLASANWVRVELELEAGDYKRYQAVLRKDNGEEISRQITPSIKTEDSREAIVLTVPAQLLPRGEYTLKLSGMSASGNFEDLNTYYFKVVQE